jgi:hypothetical protein
MSVSAQVLQVSRSLSVGLAGALTLCAASHAGAQAPYRFDSATVSGLPARNIGSATMSGRIAALDAVEEDDALRCLSARPAVAFGSR